jgi:hypothetical protein
MFRALVIETAQGPGACQPDCAINSSRPKHANYLNLAHLFFVVVGCLFLVLGCLVFA